LKRWYITILLAGLTLATDISRAAATPTGIAFCDHGARVSAYKAIPQWVRALAEPIAREHGLDPDLVLAVIAVESAFDANAVSPKNAQGLMQLIPATAKRFQVEDPFNPVQNVHGGTSYLRWLSDRFAGNTALVLAGYNAGEGAVETHGGIPPFTETQRYVQAVARHYVCRPADARVRLIRWQSFAKSMASPPIVRNSRVSGGWHRSPAGPVRLRVSSKTTTHAALGNLRCSGRAELQSSFQVCRFE
jgi:hypothetical protein